MKEYAASTFLVSIFVHTLLPCRLWGGRIDESSTETPPTSLPRVRIQSCNSNLNFLLKHSSNGFTVLPRVRQLKADVYSSPEDLYPNSSSFSPMTVGGAHGLTRLSGSTQQTGK